MSAFKNPRACTPVCVRRRLTPDASSSHRVCPLTSLLHSKKACCLAAAAQKPNPPRHGPTTAATRRMLTRLQRNPQQVLGRAANVVSETDRCRGGSARLRSRTGAPFCRQPAAAPQTASDQLAIFTSSHFAIVAVCNCAFIDSAAEQLRTPLKRK